jgi:hypothetical protein
MTEDSHLHTHCHENLKSYFIMFSLSVTLFHNAEDIFFSHFGCILVKGMITVFTLPSQR